MSWTISRHEGCGDSGGVNEGETERETETEDERRRGRRIETENSISLPREPQGRR